MAKIIPLEGLEDLIVEVREDEKEYGEFHPEIARTYVENGYDKAPKSKEERNERGLTGGWNGLNTCFEEFEVKGVNGKMTLQTKLAKTRYLVGQAMRDYVSNIEGNSERTLNEKEIQELSPNLANVSLVAPYRDGDKVYVIAQIKGGDTLGGGQVHACLVAGGVASKYLDSSKYENPLIAALEGECSEEINLPLENLNPSSFKFVVDEREIGNLNIGAIAQNVKLDEILEHYETYTKRKIRYGTDLEVAGLACIPINLEDGGLDYENVIAYIPSEEGLNKIENYEIQGKRPFTKALDSFLKDKVNLQYFLNSSNLTK
jgi:hypothetical protein